MARYLKTAISAEAKAAEDARLRQVVEAALDEIARRGDVAVRERSIRFDQWDREDDRLSEAEIQGCLAQASAPRLGCALAAIAASVTAIGRLAPGAPARMRA